MKSYEVTSPNLYQGPAAVKIKKKRGLTLKLFKESEPNTTEPLQRLFKASDYNFVLILPLIREK